MSMPKGKYEGWKNYQTWNVSLYINNEYNLYQSAVEFMRLYTGRKPYASFIRYMGMEEERTCDRIKFLSSSLCYQELNEMMRDLVE